MDKTQALELVDIIREDGAEAELYEGYSGRCMYGKETWGVDARDITPDAVKELINKQIQEVMEEDDVDDDEIDRLDELKKFRADSLGLGIILY